MSAQLPAVPTRPDGTVGVTLGETDQNDPTELGCWSAVCHDWAMVDVAPPADAEVVGTAVTESPLACGGAGEDPC